MSHGLRRRRGKRWDNFSIRVQNLVCGESFGLHGVFKNVLRLSHTLFSLQCRTLSSHRFCSPCTSLTMKTQRQTRRSRYHRVAISVRMINCIYIHIQTDCGLVVSSSPKRTRQDGNVPKTRPHTGRKVVRINFFSSPLVHLPQRAQIAVVFQCTNTWYCHC